MINCFSVRSFPLEVFWSMGIHIASFSPLRLDVGLFGCLAAPIVEGVGNVMVVVMFARRLLS